MGAIVSVGTVGEVTAVVHVLMWVDHALTGLPVVQRGVLEEGLSLSQAWGPH